MKKIIVDKDSHGTIGINWAVIAVLIACTWIFIHNLFISIPITVILLAFAFFVFWFHRVPERVIPEGDSKMITSVADGKVVIVTGSMRRNISRTTASRCRYIWTSSMSTLTSGRWTG